MHRPFHIFGFALAAAISPGYGLEESKKQAAVVAYLPEWRYEGANWETISEHTTHLLLFSMEMHEGGAIIAHDRFPRKELYKLARDATRRHGTKLMICFGGNGRSAGFSPMVRSSKRRKRFLRELAILVQKSDLDGVDYNWEYPGYSFGKGYHSDEEVDKDYKGLRLLLRETKAMFEKDNPNTPKAVTMAYYPDGRQEQLIRKYQLDKYADLLHMMSYDHGGAQHSSWELGTKSVDQGLGILPPNKLTMGLPFYGRHSRTGDWTTYEDLVQKHHPLAPTADSIPQGKYSIGFNGVRMIENKTKYALDKSIGGVMIWEVGQDCRLVQVTHGSTKHVRTCPSDDSSLLLAITRAVGEAGYTRMRSPDWKADKVRDAAEL